MNHRIFNNEFQYFQHHGFLSFHLLLNFVKTKQWLDISFNCFGLYFILAPVLADMYI